MMPISEYTNFHLSRDPRGVLTVSLDVPDRSCNVFDESVVAELQTLVDEWEHDPSLRLVLFRSDKESGLLAGADLLTIRRIRHRQTADQIVTIGQKLFDRLERLPIPTLAVIHGACLGAGLEFALACRYRVARDDGQAQLGLPEVQLGLLPAWGGTQRLPQRIGLAAALPMILTGKKLTARQAARLGLVDLVSPPEQFESDLQRFITDQLDGIAFQRTEAGFLARFRDGTRLGQWMVFRSARRQVAPQARVYPALPAALRAVERGVRDSHEAGLAAAREGFVDILFTPTCRNLIELFFQQERARKPSTWLPAETTSPRTIRRIAVIGAGTMGAGIAQLAAYHGYDVVLKDLDEGQLTRGMARVRKRFDEAAAKGRLSRSDAAARFDRIKPVVDWDQIGSVDLAIEAVSEREDVKQQVFRELDRYLEPGVAIASNTSSLGIRRLAATTGRAAEVAGLHFFNPVHRMQLIEVVRSEETSDETVATLLALIRRLRKTPLVTADHPGFVVNRVLFPYLDEAVRIVCEGVSPEEVDRDVRRFGMPMGPLELLDHIGLDVAADIAAVMSSVARDEGPTQATLEAMVARGWAGKKSGQGFYHYRNGRRGKPTPVGDLLSRREPVRPVSDIHPLPASPDLPGQQLRLGSILIHAAAQCLEEHTVSEPWMIDMGMVLGCGFAPFRGGPLRMADQRGLDRVVSDLEQFERILGDRFAPSDLLRDLSNGHNAFYPDRDEDGQPAIEHTESVPERISLGR